MFVCPRCKGALAAGSDLFRCRSCSREYPVCCGIPDFRVNADPYISIEDDRKKGELLAREGSRRSFEELLRYYYSMTPEDPRDLAERWIAHALAEVDIARVLLGSRCAALRSTDEAPLVDVGCSTAALLIAAHGRYRPLIGVDVAFRWLAVGQARLRHAGVEATLVCANAEYLPFADRRFSLVTLSDLLEHSRDPAASVREACRVSAPGATILATSNNRYAPLPEPNVHLWGVGYLPRRWQAQWVAIRRGDLHPYRIQLPSARELDGWFRRAGAEDVRTGPAALVAPHVSSGVLQRAIRLYNRARELPLIQPLLKLLGPRLSVTARRAL